MRSGLIKLGFSKLPMPNLYPFPNIPKTFLQSKLHFHGIYYAGMSHIYPWDRGTNYAVKLGREVALKSCKINYEPV
jgi:hypothetical protein